LVLTLLTGKRATALVYTISRSHATC